MCLIVSTTQRPNPAINENGVYIFHVPIILDELNEYSSTQYFIANMLARHKIKQISAHLKVETYTSNVLPDSLRIQSIDQAVVRELRGFMDTSS